jgi:hypothetical protein
MCRLPSAVLAFGGVWLAPGAHAQAAEPVPDLDFLEYLGSWQEEDDEWLVLEEWRQRRGPLAAPDSEHDGTEPQGNDDDDAK